MNCPKCGGAMVKRSGARGSFYGCKRYPECKGTRDGGGSTAAAPSGNRSAGFRMNAKFGGRCGGCGATVDAGDPIVYADRRIQACGACRPSETDLAPAPSSAGAITFSPDATAALDALIAQEPPEALAFEPFPEDSDTLAALQLSGSLDEHQRAVVEHRRGEAIVAACAGAGKSFTLVERIVALVKEGVSPGAILSLVYNRAAATSLRQKLMLRLGPTLAEKLHVFTFHAWAFTQLKAWFPGQFTSQNIVGVEGGPQEIALARTAIKTLGWGDEGLDPKDLVKLSELIREARIDTEATDAVESVIRDLPVDVDDRLAAQAVAFTHVYQEVKGRQGAIDFADMICIALRVIDRNGARARELAGRYGFVQVDEAQDLNPARLRIATWLGGAATVADLAPKLLSVGDARQSLYSFQGARPELFKSRIDLGAKLLTMPVNRRSLPDVVEAGNRIANGRDWNIGGACTPHRTTKGERVQLWLTGESEEGVNVMTEVKARVAAGLPLRDEASRAANYVCVVRTNGQAAALEVAGLVAGVPTRVLGSVGGIWSTNIGRDFLAYLMGAEEHVDNDLVRAANKPNRFIKRTAVMQAVDEAKQGASLWAALRSQSGVGARRFAGELEALALLDWPARCQRVASLLATDLEERSARSSKVNAPEDDAVEALEALALAAKHMGSLEALLNQREQQKRNTNLPAVEIATIHASKGLEWTVVFVCGAAHGRLPHKKARDLEEEARLFYVAVTRARDVCIVSTGGENPSPFVRLLDLTPEECETLAETEALADDPGEANMLTARTYEERMR